MYGTEFLLDWALKTRSGRIIASSLSLLLTLTLAVYLVPVFGDQMRLSQGNAIASARVIGNNVADSREFFSSKRYTLQYEFELRGSTYYDRAPFGNAWSSVSKETYDKATRSGRIDVLYEPTDPWNNKLAANAGGLWWKSLAWIVGLLLGMLAAGFWFVRVMTVEVTAFFGKNVVAE